jgi:soluble lytic murein transglycosylase-like protein
MNVSRRVKALSYFLAINVGSPYVTATQQSVHEAIHRTSANMRAWTLSKWGVATPEPARESTIAPLPATYKARVATEARRAGILPRLAVAVMAHESDEDPMAISHSGAVGLMQVMPGNAAACGTTPAGLLDPDTNIRCGVRILKEALAMAKGNVRNALKIYNAGPKNWNRGFKETEAYPELVFARFYSDDLADIS